LLHKRNENNLFQFQNEQGNDPVEEPDNGSILSQIKITRQKALAEQLSAQLTEEQLQQEKE
jgi:hypothetical protein